MIERCAARRTCRQGEGKRRVSDQSPIVRSEKPLDGDSGHLAALSLPQIPHGELGPLHPFGGKKKKESSEAVKKRRNQSGQSRLDGKKGESEEQKKQCSHSAFLRHLKDLLEADAADRCVGHLQEDLTNSVLLDAQSARRTLTARETASQSRHSRGPSPASVRAMRAAAMPSEERFE